MNTGRDARRSRSFFRGAAVLLIALSAQAASMPTAKTSTSLYRKQLTIRCPDKHLEMLSPAALSDLTEDFTSGLSSMQRRMVTSSMERNCRGVDMGATCGNVGFLQAAIRLRKLSAFTTLVCAQNQRCTGYSDCTTTR